MSSQTTTPPQPRTTTTSHWKIDPSHARAEFTVRHMMITNVRGAIPITRATIVYDANDVSNSKVEAELDVAHIDSGSGDRDTHLRSADFFDVAAHPTMTFKSTKVEKASGAGDLRVHGDLTIRAVTRPVVLDVELLGQGKDPWGGTRAGLIATTSFDRRDFGLTWNAALETGGILVGDKVKVTLDLQAIQQ